MSGYLHCRLSIRGYDAALSDDRPMIVANPHSEVALCLTRVQAVVSDIIAAEDQACFELQVVSDKTLNKPGSTAVLVMSDKTGFVRHNCHSGRSVTRCWLRFGQRADYGGRYARWETSYRQCAA